MGHTNDPPRASTQLPFTVLLANRGNPNYGQDTEEPLPGTPADLRLPIHDLTQASAECQSYIAQWNLGGGNWTGGDVHDALSGKRVAKVAYNGRVFDPDRPKFTLIQEATDLRSYCVPNEPSSEETHDEGPGAWQRYSLHTNPDGSISGRVSTNDDEDRGVPTTDASWDVRYGDRKEMDRLAGKSRIGVSGVVVEVTLDGRLI